MAVAMLALAGCGGGGGSGGGGSTDGTTDQPQAGSNTPPRTGAFGGGQGKLLFVQSGNAPQIVRLFDLATRQTTDLVTIARTRNHVLGGGLTRAQDGSFLVTDKISTELRDPGWMYHCAADGRILNSFQASTSVADGAAISPDGLRAANGATYSLSGSRGYETRVVITTLATGTAIEGVVLGAADEPRDKILTPPQERMVWAPDGRLFVLCRYGLFQVNPDTAAVTRLQTFRLVDTTSPSISPDGTTIWFEGAGGTGGRPAIWSLNIATGEAAMRVQRSRTGMQYAPTVSPDGQWLMMQQVSSTVAGGGTSSYFYVGAMRLASGLSDTEGLDLNVLTASGEAFTAGGRMAWF